MAMAGRPRRWEAVSVRGQGVVQLMGQLRLEVRLRLGLVEGGPPELIGHEGHEEQPEREQGRADAHDDPGPPSHGVSVRGPSRNLS